MITIYEFTVFLDDFEETNKQKIFKNMSRQKYFHSPQ